MANHSAATKMSETRRDAVLSDRFNGFEYPNDDFPFYNGHPAAISGPQWWFVMATVALGFLVLIAPFPILAGGYTQFVRAVLFFAIPLIGLAIVTPQYWKAIFRKVRGRDIGWMIGFALLNFAVSMTVAFVVKNALGASANPFVAGLPNKAASEQILAFFKTALQLFGEEVLTVLPYLALLDFHFSGVKLPRKQSIVVAWLLTAILFGSAHLPTYNWNVVQCLVIIGSARLVLSLAYIKTKNIWVSTGAHVLNDWIIFGLTILGASFTAGH